MKKLQVLKISGMVLCTLTASYASDTSKWDSIQDLDSFVKYLVDDKDSKISDIDKILDHFKANAPDKFQAICGAVKAGQTVRNNKKEWEDRYGDLSQIKTAKINTKCLATIVDTNLRPKKLELKALDDSKFDAPPTVEAPKAVEAPRAPSPKPAAPAPQKTLSQMMEEELSDDWGFDDESSANKAPSRSATPEPVIVETPAQKAERERAERLRLENLRGVRNVTTRGLEGSLHFYVDAIKNLRSYIMANKQPFVDHLRYLDVPKFQGEYASQIAELKGTIAGMNNFIAKLDALSVPTDTLMAYDKNKPLGEALDLIRALKLGMKNEYTQYRGSIDFTTPGAADEFINLNTIMSYRVNAPRSENLYKYIRSKLVVIESVYVNVLYDFRSFYATEKQKYDAMKD